MIESDIKPLSEDDKQYLEKSIALPEIRTLMADFYLGFNQPTNINRDCFYVLGAMSRAWLDKLQEDPVAGLRELHSLMHAG